MSALSFVSLRTPATPLVGSVAPPSCSLTLALGGFFFFYCRLRLPLALFPSPRCGVLRGRSTSRLRTASVPLLHSSHSNFALSVARSASTLL